MLDGATARKTNTASEFGSMPDTISDFAFVPEYNYREVAFMTETELIFDCDCSIVSFLERAANNVPDSRAILYFGNELTYFELFESVKKAASALLSLGVGHGDSVIICMPNIPQTVIAVYACNAIGAVCQIIHYLSAPEEIKRVISLSGSKFAFCHRNCEKCFDGLDITLISSDVTEYIKTKFAAAYSNSLRSLKSRKYYSSASVTRKFSFSSFMNKGSAGTEELFNVKANGAEPCAVLYDYSAGKMGNGIVLSNTAVNVLSKQIQLYFERYGAESGIFNAMPIYHGIGFAMCMHTAVVSGMPQILVPEFNAEACCKIILTDKPDMIFLSPTFFEEIIKLGLLRGSDLSFIKIIGSLGSYQHQKLKIKMSELLKSCNSQTGFISGYGRLECICASTFEIPYSGVSGEGCVGVALPGDRIEVIDTVTGEPIIDIDGEICISSPTLARGYYQNPAETSKRFVVRGDGSLWFHTGDIGKINSDGILYFRQNQSRTLKISGYTIYPSAVEDEICSLDNVIACCVVDGKNENGTAILKALVVPDNTVNLPSKEAKLRDKIISTVTENLNCMSVPQKIAFASNLPLTKSGTVNYKRVKEYIK